MEAIKQNLSAIATILAGVGATNLLVGELFTFDLVALVSMGSPTMTTVINVLAGLVGIGAIFGGARQIKIPDY